MNGKWKIFSIDRACRMRFISFFGLKRENNLNFYLTKFTKTPYSWLKMTFYRCFIIKKFQTLGTPVQQKLSVFGLLSLKKPKLSPYCVHDKSRYFLKKNLKWFKSFKFAKINLHFFFEFLNAKIWLWNMKNF